MLRSIPLSRQGPGQAPWPMQLQHRSGGPGPGGPLSRPAGSGWWKLQFRGQAGRTVQPLLESLN